MENMIPEESSTSFIMNVKELIEMAFGDDDVNIINFKILETVLFLFARQLQLLERNVEINYPILKVPERTLSVTEVKIKAGGRPSHKKKVVERDDGKRGSKARKASIDGKPGKNIRGTSTDAESSPQSKRLDRGVSSGEEPSSGRKRTSTMDKGKAASDRDATLDQSAKDKSKDTASGRGKSPRDKDGYSSSEQKPSRKSRDTSEGKGKVSPRDTSKLDEKTPRSSKGGKSSDDKYVTADGTTKDKKDSREKSPADKDDQKERSKVGSGRKGRSEDRDVSSDEASDDKTKSRKRKTRSDVGKSTTSIGGKRVSRDTSSDEILRDGRKGASVRDKDKQIAGDRKKGGKMGTEGSSGKPKLKDVQDVIEQGRERLLRIIHQRTDSKEEGKLAPSPMESLASTEVEKYEKLLIVERIPKDKAREAAGRGPQTSIVTLDQFKELAAVVRQIQAKFGIVGSAAFPDNAELFEQLRKGASLTDAMAALQLSARLEAAERALEKMTEMITDLATEKGIQLSNLSTKPEQGAEQGAGRGAEQRAEQGTRQEEGQGTGQEAGQGAGQGTGQEAEQGADQGAELGPGKSKSGRLEKEQSTHGEQYDGEARDDGQSQSDGTDKGAIKGKKAGKDKSIKDNITYDELDFELQKVYQEVMNAIKEITDKNTANADKAYKKAVLLESQLATQMNFGNRMNEVETAMARYAEQVNYLDTTLSAQLTNYQEQLTQMQYDLELGLETMAENLANSGGDPVAVAELNAQFTGFQLDIDTMFLKQKELYNFQVSLSLDLEELRKQLELLKECKADREEVVDALRDKAGLSALNGIVSVNQFDAVRGDFEKRIGKAYDKFNNQEIVWQKVIEDMTRELNEKADLTQVTSLNDQITKHLNEFNEKIRELRLIVGEPNAAAISRQIHRDAACISCAAPAHMELEEPNKIPALPAFKIATNADDSKPSDDGDHVGAPCYFGYPIPHPIDKRAQTCTRYCGGAHTISQSLTRAPPEIAVQRIRDTTIGLGTDGKPYKLDETIPMVPCRQCNTEDTEKANDNINPVQDILGDSLTMSDSVSAFIFSHKRISRRSSSANRNSYTS